MTTALMTPEGVKWTPNGQSNLSGPVLELFRALDGLFLRLAAEAGAEEHRFPIFIPAAELRKLDYFRSFPHLVTFPVALDPDPENIRAFMAGPTADESGQLHLTKTAPICDCLTPAACYHFYIHFQGQKLARTKYLTTRAHCFRRETHYLPLQRQWNFNMREIVCLGRLEDVKAFLTRYRERLTEIFVRLELPIRWEVATDPFFDPSKNPKHLLQQLDPVKTEMIFGDGLSIGSINLHRSYFGEAFGIRFEDEDASSGCVAFGMERWIHAVITQFGEDPRRWPKLEGLP